jgi:hypothetical protein
VGSGGWGVRLALSDVHGISEAEAARIADGQPYASLLDFWERARPSRPLAQRLAQVGALDAFGANRRDLQLHLTELHRGARGGRGDQLPLAGGQKTAPAGLPDLSSAERLSAELGVLSMDASRNLMDDHRAFLDELGVVTARRLRAARHGETVLVAGAKAATQTPPIRSGKRVIFTTLDDGTGLVDLAFFDDSHDACAHTVFHSWLLLVRGVVQRRGPRSLSVVGAAAWNLADLVELRREEGLDGGGPALAEPQGEGGAEDGTGRRAEDGSRGTGDPTGGRRIQLPTGYEMHPWADLRPAGEGPAGGTEVVAPEPGECGMTILCVRFQLPPTSEAALPGLLGTLEEFTPVIEALPPDGALADLRGAERYFGRDAVELAALIRVRALAWYGVDCMIGAGPGPMFARMALREARPRNDPRGARRPLRRRGVPRRNSPSGAARSRHRHRPHPVRVRPRHRRQGRRRTPVHTATAHQRPPGRELHEMATGHRPRPGRTERRLPLPRRRTPFPRDELDPDLHRRALLSAAEELGTRLRALEKVCRTLTLTVRYADRSTTTRSRTLPEPTAHSSALTDAAYRMYEALGLQRARVRSLTLRAEGLCPAEQASYQLTFDPVDEKVRRVEEVADRVRAKFGPRAVMPGSLVAWRRNCGPLVAPTRRSRTSTQPRAPVRQLAHGGRCACRPPAPPPGRWTW